MSFLEGLISISMLKISPNHSIGEMLMVLTTYHGVKISIFLHIAGVVGLRLRLARLLIELTLLEIGLFPIWLCLRRLLSTVLLEAVAMEVLRLGFIYSQWIMGFLKKAVKIIWRRILSILLVQICRNAKIARILKDRSQEIRAIAGLLPAIQFGRLLSTA